MVDPLPTSQSAYKQELFWPSDFISHSALEHDSGSDHDSQWDDIVASSQPFEDGEEDLKLPVVPMTPLHFVPLFYNSQALPSSPTQSPNASVDSDPPHPRRAHLVFRASPVKPKLAPTVTRGTTARPRNLVRRVTMDTEIERRRKRACKKARHIVKKLRALATATMKLKRQHRNLCKFVGDTYAVQTNQRFTSL